jgi:hypothetical protein
MTETQQSTHDVSLTDVGPGSYLWVCSCGVQAAKPAGRYQASEYGRQHVRRVLRNGRST